MTFYNCLVVLPARLDSTRLPGKPLADICGKPMVVRSAENVISQCRTFADVIVATDSHEIAKVCAEYGIQVYKTKGNHKTGTDRVAEVSEVMKGYDYIINAQPDEPLLEKGVIQKIYSKLYGREVDEILCGMAEIKDKEAIKNPNIGKVVCDKWQRAMYISRSPVPFNATKYFTQVCVYGFARNQLASFSRMEQSPTELVEGIELLRWLESGSKIKMIEVPGERLSVDTMDDLVKIRKIYKERNLK